MSRAALVGFCSQPPAGFAPPKGRCELLAWSPTRVEVYNYLALSVRDIGVLTRYHRKEKTLLVYMCMFLIRKLF